MIKHRQPLIRCPRPGTNPDEAFLHSNTSTANRGHMDNGIEWIGIVPWNKCASHASGGALSEYRDGSHQLAKSPTLGLGN